MDASFIERLRQFGLIPIVTIDDARHAASVGRALARGGLPCAEVTLRTDAALDAIRAMSETGVLLVGAGTVLDVERVEAAIDAGAQFIVTPGLHHRVVDCCIERGIPIVPGVATASEIAWAYDRGLRLVKFFPAETLGGVCALKALCAPYGMMRFIPTGGIDAGKVGAYLQIPQVVACGGSWLAASSRYASGDYEAIERTVREALALIPNKGLPSK